jgi:hypothetical protein
MNPTGPAAILRRFGLGRLAYAWFHRPVAEWKTDDARMARAAARLEKPARLAAAPAGTWPVCRYLTGTRFWHQTVFCARSLEIACDSALRFEFFDDGSLTPRQSAVLRRLFPHARVIDAPAAAAQAERLLPRARFPLLQAARAAHPLMRKLVDLHLGADGPTLCLDSDMLFFGPATELRRWLESPDDAWFLPDVLESYVLPGVQLAGLTGRPLRPLVNTGIVAGDDRKIDWAFLEECIGRLEPELRVHRLLEQSLTAFHLARIEARPLPADRYRVLISPIAEPPPGVLLHYCWNSNPGYRCTEWRRFLAGPYSRARGSA